jgi:tetratricopeptide (TPR) repeat protein
MTSWSCRLVVSALTVASLVLAGPSAAVAQAVDLKATAKQYVTDGLKAQSAGRYDEAISLYNKAYELVPHPELLFNLGQAHRLKGEKAIALNYYQKYLAVDSRGRGATEAGQWVTQIDLELRAEAEALRKAEEERAAEAERQAQAAREAEAMRARAEERKAKEKQRIASSAKANSSTAAPPLPEVTAHSAPVAYEPRILTTKRIVALGLGGAALVSGGLAYYFRRHSNDLYDRYLSKISGSPMFEETSGYYLREANRNKLRSSYLILSGVALLGVGGVLWFTGADDRQPSSRTASRWIPVVNGEMAGLLLSGGF